MRAVVQRVAEARVRIGDEVVGEIGPGLCVLLGVGRHDDEAAAERLAGRVARLRIFENDEGKFDLSVLDTGGAVLVVSNFTLIADTAKGNRPSFSEAAPPELTRARQLFTQTKLEESRVAFEAFAKKNPTNAEAVYYLGRIALARQDFDSHIFSVGAIGFW